MGFNPSPLWMKSQGCFRRPQQPGLLTRQQSIRRLHKAAPRFYLHKHQALRRGRDQINFTHPGFQTPGQNFITLAPQQRFYLVLSPPSQMFCFRTLRFGTD